jgi:hypothetical protein
MSRFPANLLRIVPATTLVALTLFVLGAGRVCIAGHDAHGSYDAHSSEHAEAEELEVSASGISGIELGEFKIRSDYPVEAQKSTVRFVLHAAVKGEKSAEMRRLVEKHEQKLRDLVITTTRLAPLAVFEEPDLATFRRRLLIRMRRTLPELAVDDLYVSDFSLIVKSL